MNPLKLSCEVIMCNLTAYQMSELRTKYEKLDRSHQRGLPSIDSTLQQLSTEDISAIFRENQHNSSRWPTFTDLESHMRNCATLKHYGAPVVVV